MNRYRPPTIKYPDLQAHIEELGWNYDEIIRLFETDISITSMVKLLKANHGKAPSNHTLAKWKRIFATGKPPAK